MNNKQHILLTGGTGLIGSILTQQLLDKGYMVSHLSRCENKNPKVKTYLWDIAKSEIDPRCIDGVDTVVHLAGAGIAEKRWTKKRKKELVDSRTKSIALVYKVMKEHPNQVKNVVSASATGYYGDRKDELLTEESPPAFDFLSTCCIDWEHAVDYGEAMGLRIVKFRTGVVLNKKGGALPQLALPVKFGVGSPLGNGKQWIPWIHSQDVIDIYLTGIENPELNGVYNMVAPNPVTNKQMTQAVAKQLHRPLWAPKVPAFALRLVLGEMSEVVLGSDKVSAQKIQDAGFVFKYPNIAEALKEIYG
jgi:uncharacterized protein (TIGR01777 family)